VVHPGVAVNFSWIARTEVVMSDESRPDEEYEPEDADPDRPIAVPATDPTPPLDADPADWLDQQRDVPVDDDDRDAAD
jgi:hypothetical protein